MSDSTRKSGSRMMIDTSQHHENASPRILTPALSLSTGRVIKSFGLVGLLFIAAAGSVSRAADINPTTQTTDMVVTNLPDPLKMADGTPVTSAEQWREKRRPELLALFAHEMYGVSPGRPADMKFEVFDTDPKALGGKATRRQVAVYFTGKPDGQRMDLLIYLPNSAMRPVPVIFGLNFWGNHAVSVDPGIRITTSYMEEGKKNPYLDLSGVRDHRATEASRGVDAHRWPVEEILAHGFGFVTAYRGDIDPDLPDGFKQSIKALYPDLQNRGDNFSTIGAWAWALSRGMDYLQTDADIDPNRVAVFGWSRLGKAAIWAAANDERFALVISSESGAGGAKIFHHNVGENIHRLNTVFPHWYCQNFRKYDGQETTLPFDQHEVLALIAPRPLYVANSDPSSKFDYEGEFLGLKNAEPVYRLLGGSALPAEELPPIDHAVQGESLAYHRRTGRHDVTAFDWEQYLIFCEAHLRAHAGAKP